MGGWAQAVGLLMGTGNVGAHLDESFDAINTYGVPIPAFWVGAERAEISCSNIFCWFLLILLLLFFFF